MDLLMLRMLPVREPGRLVQIQKITADGSRGVFSYPMFDELQRDLASFDALARAISHPGTRGYVDLSYDVVRHASGNFASLPVPRLNGVGSFSRKPEYFVTKHHSQLRFPDFAARCRISELVTFVSENDISCHDL
jgi:hypothetical protein